MADYKKFCESCGEKIAFPPEYLGHQVNCPHCQALTLLSDPAAAAVPHQVPATPAAAPATPAAAPLAAVPEAKESFWKRFKGTIELVGAFIAIAGVGIGAWQYFKPSEEKLPVEEQYALAHQYLEGKDKEKNVKRGGELLEMAAQKGHVKSMIELGQYAKEGKAGRKQDYGEALKWFELAAEKGDASALYEIGIIYWDGNGVKKDLKKAYKYFRESAEKGFAAGQYYVGKFFHFGLGDVIKNYDESLKWRLKAATQGNAKAQEQLGWMYTMGEGVKTDYAEAFKWYRKAAEQGMINSQNNLVDFFSSGRGVEKDYAGAFKWCRIAAEQNDKNSQRMLSYMYSKGQGVQKDIVAAYAWVHIAARDKKYILAKQLKDSIGKEMTPEQIAKSEALAKEIISKNSKLQREKGFQLR